MATLPAADEKTLDMLASDLADMLDRFSDTYGHLGDIAETHIRPHLAEFLAKVQGTSAADPEANEGAPS